MATPLSLHVSLPAAPASVLMWAQLLLVWATINYGPNGDEAGRQPERAADARKYWINLSIRVLLASAGVCALLVSARASRWQALALLTVTAAGIVGLPVTRNRLARSQAHYRYLAEWECAANVLYAATAAILIGRWALAIRQPLLVLPGSSGQLSVITLALAAGFFAVRGGTHVVRSVLDKADTLPRTSPKKALEDQNLEPRREAMDGLDVSEYNRGRLIGNIERILLMYVVVVGSYEAIGFLIAAKGLIRAREFEQRDFAEYFIVGSLVSVLVALVLGAAIRASASAWWGH